MDNAKSGEKFFTLALFRPALVLLIICGLCASLIATVYVVTKSTIEENDKREERVAITRIYPDYASHVAAETQAELGECDSVSAVYNAENELLGYAVTVSPMGFANEIVMIVGINTDFTLKKIVITSISETAGIGSRVNDDTYLDTYAGLSGDVDFGHGVDAISGATRSSKAVLRGIKSALEVCKVIYEGGDAA